MFICPPSFRTLSIFFFCSIVSLAGCGTPKKSGPVASEPVAVIVTEPAEKELADFAEFTGRTDAVESVEIRARVSGYLNKILYKPGSEVEAGAPLFEIDSRPYDAILDQNLGILATSEATLKQARADMARAQDLHDKKVSTQSDYDKAVADLAHAEASIQSSQANVAQAKLNQDFTHVSAPVAGRTSREMITIGNLVNADTTALTTIVSIDPIYAYFDVDERMLLDIQKRIREKKMESARERDDVPIYLGLANENGFPHAGTMDVVDNRVDSGTGTMQIRGRFDNADRVLTPGLFVRIQFQMGPARPRLLVPEQALGQQQGQRYVYVVTPEKKIDRRNVTVGRLDSSMRVIETGLKRGDSVVVKGQQRIRPGIEVRIETEKAAVGQSEPTAKKPH